jgi:hypothetical protein
MRTQEAAYLSTLVAVVYGELRIARAFQLTLAYFAGTPLRLEALVVPLEVYSEFLL